MTIGVPYYPEHWDRERWPRDVQLMKDAGIERVRMGEFAWDRLEPEEGVYDFEWLNSAVDLFAGAGIRTILCTPTATYPAWLKDRFPDLHQSRSDGILKHWGQRQDACLNHPGYRRAALNIAERVSSFFAGHPGVAAWQIDNELGCHDTHHCWCGCCRQAFIRWLEERFGGDVQEMNRAWGTAFWSQTYSRFDQVELPMDTADCKAAAGHNPGLSLDYYRFSSDTMIRFLNEQVRIVRRNCPGIPVTHNFMGGFTGIDYFKMAEQLDVVSWDNYPFFELEGRRTADSSDYYDLNRSFKKQNFWVMEQAANGGGWTHFHPSVEPGQMRLWAWQAAARGADFICFFRWRTSRWGAEQYWHGILDHHGIPRRRYGELTRIGREFRRLSPELEGSSVPAGAAVLYDYSSLWALEIQPHVIGDQPISYPELVRRWVEACRSLGVTVDMVSPEEDFSSCRLLIAPSLHVCTPGLLEKLRSYTAAGGILVTGLRSGVKDAENAVTGEVLPGTVLSEIMGVTVEEYDAFGPVKSDPVFVEDSAGRSFPARSLADLLETGEDTETLMTYRGRYYTGRPAVTSRRYGKGRGIYVGTVLEPEILSELVRPFLGEAGIELSPRRGELEVSARVKGDQVYRFYLNHSGRPLRTGLLRPGYELLDGRDVRGVLELEPFGAAIVREG